jgi:hypothetical protein
VRSSVKIYRFVCPHIFTPSKLKKNQQRPQERLQWKSQQKSQQKSERP